MILDNPLYRLVLKAISACGLIDDRYGPDTIRVEQRDSPFVLVARAPGGGWGVFRQNLEVPLAAFDEIQEACDYASELARTRTDSMVLIRNEKISAANPESSVAKGAR